MSMGVDKQADILPVANGIVTVCKPYVYGSETVCLHVVNHRFTMCKPYLYEV